MSLFTFEAPIEGNIEVEARVIFRRAYYDLMQWKGWDVPDIIMEQKQIIIL